MLSRRHWPKKGRRLPDGGHTEKDRTSRCIDLSEALLPRVTARRPPQVVKSGVGG